MPIQRATAKGGFATKRDAEQELGAPPPIAVRDRVGVQTPDEERVEVGELHRWRRRPEARSRPTSTT